MGILFGVWKCIELERFLTMVYGHSSDCSLDFSIARSCEPITFLRVVMPLSAGGTGKNENIFWCARYTVVVSVPGQRYYFLDIHVLSCRTVLLYSHICTSWLACQDYVWCLLSRPAQCFGSRLCILLVCDHFAKYLTTFSYTSLLLLLSISCRSRVKFPSGPHDFPVLLQRYKHRVLHFHCRSVSFFIDDFSFIPLYSIVLVTGVLCCFGPGCFSVFVLNIPCATYVAYLCLPSLALSSWYYEMEASFIC